MSVVCTVAIATYGVRIQEIALPPTRSDLCYFVVWQAFEGPVPSSLIRPDVQVVRMMVKGLSRARNVALAQVETPVVLLMDDDVALDAESVSQAAAAFLASGATVGVADLLHGPEKALMHTRDHSWRPEAALDMVASCEIFVCTQHIRALGVGFNPAFGAGSALYPLGEENLFLYEAKVSGASFTYLPYVLGWHPPVSSGLRDLGFPGLLARARLTSTLFPRRRPWMRRVRQAYRDTHLGLWTRLRLALTPTPPVPPTRLSDVYDPSVCR